MTERLTIVILSYNRQNLLRKAVASCFEQSNKNFDLIIVDNGSTDGAADYINLLDHSEIEVIKKFNGENLGAPASELIGVEAAKTPWITYLCDDDYLDAGFVENFYSISNFDSRSCIVFSSLLVDECGSIITTSKNLDESLNSKNAFRKLMRNQIHAAGISNFIFRKTAFNIKRLIPFYPNGWFRDTMLIMRASLDSGIVTSSVITYNRLIHAGMVSSYTDEKMLGFFEALIRYHSDLKQELVYSKNEDLLIELKPLSPYRFFESIIFPILISGNLTPKMVFRYLKTAWSHNKSYFPHVFLLIPLLPISFPGTLKARKKLNQARLKMKAAF